MAIRIWLTVTVIVRVLQVFDSFELRQKEDAPTGAAPPSSWTTGAGRRPVEEIFPRSALTIYSTVSVCRLSASRWNPPHCNICNCRVESGFACELRRHEQLNCSTHFFADSTVASASSYFRELCSASKLMRSSPAYVSRNRESSR